MFATCFYSVYDGHLELQVAVLLWSPYVIGQTIKVLPCGFYLSICLFSSPNLSGRSWMSTILGHNGVALMRIWNAGLKKVLHAAGWKYRTQKSPFWHHRTTLSGYIFGTKACIDNRKKLVKQQYLLHMSC